MNVYLNDAVAAVLNAQAAAQGLSVQAYLERVFLSTPARPPQRLALEEFDRLLDEEATLSPSPAGTFSRAELYSDHD